MKKIFMTLAAGLLTAGSVSAQLISSNQEYLTQDSQGIVITYRPDDANSNKKLADLPESTQLYAHVGVITNSSAGDADWKHSSTWKDNADKYKLKYVGPNTYTFSFSNFKEFFGLNDTERVLKLVFVFRDATASKEGHTAAGGDITLEVIPKGFSYETIPAMTSAVVGDEIAFSLKSSTAATLSISLNGQTLTSKDNVFVLDYSYKFTEPGTYQFESKSSASSSTKKTNVTVSDAKNLAFPDGLTPQPGIVETSGGTTFCLAAPAKGHVRLVGSWDGDDFPENLDSQLMNYCDYEGFRYFWLTVPNLDSEKIYTYYYIVDNKTRVADPYSRLVLDRTNDTDAIKAIWDEGSMELPPFPNVDSSLSFISVYKADMNQYDWEEFTIPEITGLFIYELLFRDFTGDEGKANGNGTVRQAIEKIPYLKELGVNAVELMPITEFVGNNSWGYNPCFWFAPDKSYGSPDDYKEFINECHKNGIAVIMDIVLNQSESANPYYKMYSIDSNPFFNKTAPHATTYYQDWNQDYPLVKKYFEDCLRYWMTEYNVDGFRFDFVKGLGDNDSYAGGQDANNPSRVTRMKNFHSVIRSVKPRGIHINELLGSSTEEKALAADYQLVWAPYNSNGCNFVRGTSIATNNLDGTGSGCPWNYRVTYIESHDEERAAYKGYTSGVAGVKGDMDVVARRAGVLAAQHLLSPGPKMIWQFEELVADETTKKSNGDNNMARKKVIWGNLDNPSYKAVHDIYAAIGQLRLASQELFINSGTLTKVGLSSGSANTVRSMRLIYGDKEVVAFINPAVSGDAKTVSVETELLSPDNSMLICASPGAVPELKMNGTAVEANVAPNSVVVYGTKNALGVNDVITDLPGSFSSCEVYGGEGEILIIGEYDKAEVFNIQGLSMGRLTGLDRGIYIVRVDDVAFKVAVK